MRKKLSTFTLTLFILFYFYEIKNPWLKKKKKFVEKNIPIRKKELWCYELCFLAYKYMHVW